MTVDGETPVELLYRLRAAAQERIVVRAIGLVLAQVSLFGVIYGFFLPTLSVGLALSTMFGALFISSFWLFVRAWSPSWRSASDLVTHAKRVEKTRSTIHGRLILLAEHDAGSHPDLSPELLDRLHIRVRRALRETPLTGSEMPKVSQHWAVWLLLIGCGLWGWSNFGLIPDWQQIEGLAASQQKESVEQAAVGDLVLEYDYPDYTGLPAMTVSNSTGEVHAVPGTRVTVTAKAAHWFREAEIQLDTRPPQRADVLSNNRMRGSFMIDNEQKAYWFSMLDDRAVVESPHYTITVEPDQPPIVSLSTSDDAQMVGLTQPINAVWKAEDDYGVQRVRWRVDGVDGTTDLLGASTMSTTATGKLAVRPVDLGLSVGDRAKIQIIAWDNNDVDGAQRGESEDLLIIVGGEEGASRHAKERQVALLEAIVPILSQHLLQVWPPANEGKAIARWGERLFMNMQPLEKIFEEYKAWGVVGLERRLLEDIAIALRTLVQRTQDIDTLDGERSEESEYLIELKASHDMLVLVEEDALYLLDRAIRAAVMDQTLSIAKRMIRLSSRVQRAAEGDATPGQLATLLSAVERMVDESAEVHAQLDAGALQNMAMRGSEQVSRLIEAVRATDLAGDNEKSVVLVLRLATVLRDTGVGVSDMIEAMRSQESEVQSEAEGLVEALEKLESDQRDLLDVLHAVRKKQGDNLLPQMSDLWEEVLTQVYESTSLVDSYVQDLARYRRSFGEQTQAGEMLEILDRLEIAVRARDIEGALRGLDSATDKWRMVEVLAQFELVQRQGATGPTLNDVSKVSAQLLQVDRRLAQLQQLAKEADPITKMETIKLAPQQSKLGAKLGEVQRAAEKLAVKLPVPPRGMLKHLENASVEMSRAEGSAASGEPLSAQGSMGSAAQQISDALDALLEAMAAGASSGSGESSGGTGADGDPVPFDMEIPGPDEFLSAEAYREALLKGLATEAPAAYEATKNKYFEELVIQ